MFFVQVARLEDPEGVGRTPLLMVGGSPSGRGVITSASYEVRAYGVRSGMPTAQALRLCPEATVVPVPRGACAERSRAVRSVLEELAPVVQAASIDEFYLDLSGMERLLRGESLEETAHRIRRRVLEGTRISVSIGGSTRKMVAKLAAGEAKPAGVHIVPPGGEAAFMRRFRLAQIPGVGPAFLSALEAKGLSTVEDILPVKLTWLERWFGSTRGRWLYHRVRGEDPSPVSPGEDRKSVSSERTFPRDLVDRAEMERALLDLSASVGRGLRKRGLRARTVTLKARTTRFRNRTVSRTLPEPVESDTALFQVARELLASVLEGRRPGYRLLGVSASNLVEAEEGAQLALFQEEAVESERDRILSRAADRLRTRFGEGALRPGRMVEPNPRGREEDTDGA